MSPASTYTAESALDWCRDVTRRRARNFYYGLKLLPARERTQLYAIYAWMRRADDIADDMANDAGAGERADAGRALDELQRATRVALSGSAPNDDPVLFALRTVAQDVTLDPALFDAVIDGQRDDLSGRTYDTFEALREYCYRVASTVGLLCIEVWGYDDPRAPELAIDRGIAFQLTNMLRDYVEDFESGRVYLPAEDFRRHDLTPEAVRRFAVPDRCRAFLEEQVERAESYYERSLGLEPMISPSCRSTLWAMTAIYHRLLDRIREDPRQIVQGERVRLSPFVKSSIAVRARWRARHAGTSGR